MTATKPSENQEPDTTELALARLWKVLLQMPELPGPSDDFFDLGGDSITMVTALNRINEEFAVELPVSTLLRAPSLRELSDLVDHARGSCAQPR